MKKCVSWILFVLMLVTLFSTAASAETPSVAIVLANTLGDRSFYDSAKEGIDRLEADFGTVTKVIHCYEDASQYEIGLDQGAQACDIVVAVGWQFWDALDSGVILEDYPDKKFLFVDNGLADRGDNLMSIVYAQNEGSFLVGYIAGKMTKTGKIGAVGGQDSDTINDFIVGYKAGAALANPDCEVLVQYSNDYEDPAKGKECALALHSMDCDIIFQIAGKTGEGVFEAAREAGFYAIGVDGDQKYINPDVIICSMVKDVGRSIYEVVSHPDEYFKGGTIWKADMATGFIDVVYGTEDMPQQVSDELKSEVEELKQKIISGEIVVPTTLE